MMEPLTMMALAGGAQALGGWLSSRKQAKAQKKARKEQKAMDALMNMISIAGGRGIAGMAPAQAVTDTSSTDALQALGQLGGNLAGVMHGDQQQALYNMTKEERMQLEREKMTADVLGQMFGSKNKDDSGLPSDIGATHSQLQSVKKLTPRVLSPYALVADDRSAPRPMDFVRQLLGAGVRLGTSLRR